MLDYGFSNDTFEPPKHALAICIYTECCSSKIYDQCITFDFMALHCASTKGFHCFDDSIASSKKLLETNLFFPKSPSF